MSPTILVTDASSGFGRAIAERFVRDGHCVIATARRQDRLDALGRALGDRLLPFVLDMNDSGAIAALPGSLPEGWREVDVLVKEAIEEIERTGERRARQQGRRFRPHCMCPGTMRPFSSCAGT